MRGRNLRGVSGCGHSHYCYSEPKDKSTDDKLSDSGSGCRYNDSSTDKESPEEHPPFSAIAIAEDSRRHRSYNLASTKAEYLTGQTTIETHTVYIEAMRDTFGPSVPEWNCA